MSKVKGRASIELLLDQKKLDTGLRQAENKFKKLGSKIATAGANLTILGGAGVAGFFATAKAAGDAQETISRFNAVFRDQSEGAREFASILANDIGRSETDILNALSSYQAFFVGLGKGSKESAKLSKELTSLALDFASFNNVSDEDAQSRFLAALSGSSEVFDKYGINIKSAALEQEFLSQGIAETTATASEQQKVMARLAIITESMGAQGALGDAIRTSDSFNNSMKRLNAEVKTLKESIGAGVIDSFSSLVSIFSTAAKAASAFALENKATAKAVVIGTFALVSLGVALTAVGGAFLLISQILPFIVGAIVALTAPISAVAIGVVALLAGLGLWASSASTVKTKSAELSKETDKTKLSIEELNEAISETPASVSVALTAYGQMNKAIVTMRESLAAVAAIESIKEKFNLTDSQIAPVSKMAAEWLKMGVSIEEVLQRLSNSPELSLLSDENRYSAFADTKDIVLELEKKAKLDEAIAKHGERAIRAAETLNRLQSAGVTNSAVIQKQYMAIEEATKAAMEAEKQKNLIISARESVQEDELNTINLNEAKKALSLTDGVFSSLSDSLKEAIRDASPVLALLSDQISAALAIGDTDLANKLTSRFKDIKEGLLGEISDSSSIPKDFNFGQLAEAGSSAALKLLAGNDSPLVGLQKKANKTLELIQKQTNFAVG